MAQKFNHATGNFPPKLAIPDQGLMKNFWGIRVAGIWGEGINIIVVRQNYLSYQKNVLFNTVFPMKNSLKDSLITCLCCQVLC